MSATAVPLTLMVSNHRHGARLHKFRVGRVHHAFHLHIGALGERPGDGGSAVIHDEALQLEGFCTCVQHMQVVLQDDARAGRHGMFVVVVAAVLTVVQSDFLRGQRLCHGIKRAFGFDQIAVLQTRWQRARRVAFHGRLAECEARSAEVLDGSLQLVLVVLPVFTEFAWGFHFNLRGDDQPSRGVRHTRDFHEHAGFHAVNRGRACRGAVVAFAADIKSRRGAVLHGDARHGDRHGGGVNRSNDAFQLQTHVDFSNFVAVGANAHALPNAECFGGRGTSVDGDARTREGQALTLHGDARAVGAERHHRARDDSGIRSGWNSAATSQQCAKK